MRPLTEIEADAKAATLGRWFVPDRDPVEIWNHEEEAIYICKFDAPRTNKSVMADATFIAHARTDIPDLLARVRELEALMAREDER